MKWGAFSRERVRSEEAERLSKLHAEGRTVELSTLRPEQRVLRISFGLGDEFWLVLPGYRVEPRLRRIDGAHLIVDSGQRVTDAGKLAFLEHRIEHIVYSV